MTFTRAQNYARQDFALAFYHWMKRRQYTAGYRVVGRAIRNGNGPGPVSCERTRQLVNMAYRRKRDQ